MLSINLNQACCSEMNTAVEEIFDRHYPDGPSALKRFRQRLAEAKLEFDVEANIREQKMPPQAGFPRGLPSFIYYYVPGTQFGSAKKLPAGPSDPRHAFTSDGIGLNMGCPIRLSRAFDVLFSLKPDDRHEPLAQLRTRENHFACIEELLWLTFWKQQTEVSRGGELVPQAGGKKAADVDWFFFSAGTPIYLEAKLRPTDWMRTPDCGARAINEAFFGDTGRKFPAERSVFQKCLVGITGFAEPLTGFAHADNSFFALCEKKLLATPGLDGILYRSLLGSVYVCSLDKQVVAQIGALIRVPEFCDYPFGYPVLFNRQVRQQRGESNRPTRLPERGRVHFAIVPDNQPPPTFHPQFPYRFQIPKRGKRGEPVFQYIPPFLNSSSSQMDDGSSK